MPRITRFAKRFAADAQGSILIVFGISLLTLLLVVGLAYDASRAYNAKSLLQSGLDAAALAGAKELQVGGSTDAQVQLTTQTYFNQYLPSLAIDYVSVTPLETLINRSASSVTASVQLELNSLFGGLAGTTQTLTIAASSNVVYKANRLEVAMVLDITGSMGQVPSGGGPRKIDGVKIVAPAFIDALYASNPIPGTVRVGLVPFSASVNVGSNYQAATGITPTWTCTGGGWQGGDGWQNCGFSTPPDSCVVERSNGSYDDSAPGSGNYSSIGPAGNSNYSCPTAGIQPLTDLLAPTARSAFEASINNLQPAGGTAGHVGLAWGWYLLSDQWASVFGSNAGGPYVTGGSLTKAVVLMTDGGFNTSYFNGPQNSLTPTQQGSSIYQATQLCQGLAAKGVKVFTVGFDISGDPQFNDAHAMLSNCATNSGGQYYQPTNATALNAAFQDVVTKLANLRVASQ